MMKKILCLLLALLISVFICSCGTASYDDAPTLDFGEFSATARENRAKSDELYKDKAFVITGKVKKIKSDCVELNYSAGSFPLEIELDSSWLVDLSVGDEITVVGKFNGNPSFPRFKKARMIVYRSQD